ncbi:cytochrome P450 [Streptomyces sp. NPDC051577]|uniref:cytochrome P450 n=1 Tax=Streptomyces sp. NPDC051577 TaxID=3155166 RepID=UPI00342E14E3
MELDSGLPSAPGALPVLGHALRLRRDPLRFMKSLSRSGGLVRFRVYTHDLIMICDPELTRAVLNDSRTFDKGGPIIRLVDPLVGDGLATCPHSRHRRYRRSIQPIINPERLPGYGQKVTAAVDAVTGDWRHGQILDIPVEMRRIGMHAGAQTWFSGAMPPSVVDSMADDFTTVLVGFAQQVARPEFICRLPLPGNRRQRRAISRIRQTLADAADRRPDAAHHDDLLAALRTTADGATALSAQVIVDHAATFIAASTATIGSTMAWVWHLLARHPSIRERLHDEVDAALGVNVTASFEHLPRLPLARRIITETLRMYPSLWLGTRVVTADTHLAGHGIPAGTILAYSPYIVGRSDLYDAPDRFDPDRWDVSCRPAPPRHAFVPFGGGARQCIAIEYAPTEMVLALASIASRWCLEPIHGTPLRPRAAANLTPRGLRLTVVVRRPHGRGGTICEKTPVSEPEQAGTRRPTKRTPWLL